MTEPFLDYGNPASDTAWYAWLQAKGDKQLTAYWEYVRNWSPAVGCPEEDLDAVQLKYELTAQLMSERGL